MKTRRWLQSILDASTLPTPRMPWETGNARGADAPAESASKEASA